MDVTFVEHAEDDVDRDHGRQYQPQRIGQRRIEGQGRAW